MKISHYRIRVLWDVMRGHLANV